MTDGTTFEPTFTGPGGTMFGTYFPRHYVVAVIHDAAKAEAAAAEIRAAGYDEGAVEVWRGERVLANHAAYLERHGLLNRVASLFPGEESEVLAEYLAEARNGANFVTVLAPHPGPRETARGILRAHGGHAMRYYGNHTFTDL
jgi:hypothetical protein